MEQHSVIVGFFLPSASTLWSPPREGITAKQILLLMAESGSWRVLARKTCKCSHWNAWCIISPTQQASQTNNKLPNQKTAQSYISWDTRQENHSGMKTQRCLCCFLITMVRKHGYNFFCPSFLWLLYKCIERQWGKEFLETLHLHYFDYITHFSIKLQTN